MASLRFFLGGAVALALISCQQTNVRSVTTPGTNFGKYHTYAIRPGNVVYPGAPESQRDEIAKRIQNAVAAELESRGLTPQPNDPDLIVTYTAGAQQVAGSRGGVAPRAPTGSNIREPGGGGYDEPGVVRAQEWPDAPADLESRRAYTEGNLVIDLIDGKSRKLVWRATANAEIASDKTGRNIDAVIIRAFKDVSLGTPPRKD
jgi:hypothetical protein